MLAVFAGRDMEIKKILSCRRFVGKEWCPAENDGHCMLGKNVNTVGDGIPYNCPLIKSPILLQLKIDERTQDGKEIDTSKSKENKKARKSARS